MANGLRAPIGHRCQIEDTETECDGQTPLCPGFSPILFREGSHLARSRRILQGAYAAARASAPRRERWYGRSPRMVARTITRRAGR